jgi:putative N6-adenine-specific DNA methylase
MENYDIIVKTQHGLEGVLAKEIEHLGGKNIEILSRAVVFEGNDELLYKANYCLRTALRVLKPIASVTATDEEFYYKKLRHIAWEDYFALDKTFAVDAVVSGRIFTHSKYAALKAKDAIADRFRDKTGQRPSVETENPDLRIHIHINENKITVALDSTGKSLDRRGYRLDRTQAPINEVLAAGIVLLAGYDGSQDFYDLMCGSGTFSIEAAMIAANIPPGIAREFAFEKWRDFNAELWEKVKKDAEEAQTEPTGNIFASDNSRQAVDASRANIERAAVDEWVMCSKKDFFEVVPKNQGGIVVLNPPYGERMTPKNIQQLYENIGAHLKNDFQGCEAWVISSDFDALQRIGLAAKSKIKLFNGALECKLHQYELYKGSRNFTQDSEEELSDEMPRIVIPSRNISAVESEEEFSDETVRIVIPSRNIPSVESEEDFSDEIDE